MSELRAAIKKFKQDVDIHKAHCESAINHNSRDLAAFWFNELCIMRKNWYDNQKNVGPIASGSWAYGFKAVTKTTELKEAASQRYAYVDKTIKSLLPKVRKKGWMK